MQRAGNTIRAEGKRGRINNRKGRKIVESTAEFVGGGRVSKLGSDVPLPHRLLSQLIRMEGGTGEGWQSREPRVRKERPAQGLGPFLPAVSFLLHPTSPPSHTRTDLLTQSCGPVRRRGRGTLIGGLLSRLLLQSV